MWSTSGSLVTRRNRVVGFERAIDHFIEPMLCRFSGGDAGHGKVLWTLDFRFTQGSQR